MEEIILYTIDCPACLILEQRLNEKNIEYIVCRDTEQMNSLGIEVLPVLSVNGELLKYSKAIKWVKEK